MSVEHLPRNNTIPIPIDRALFSGVTPLTGEAANLSLRIICLENGFTLDNTDGQFRLSAATPTRTMAAFTDYSYDYYAIVAQSSWPRGTYRGIIRHTTTSMEFEFDFTLGVFVPRQLGYTAVYDGTTLNLSVWVEEMGVAQTDFVALNNCAITDSTGHTLTDGNLGNNMSPYDGVFNFQATVALAAVHNFIFKCDAEVTGPSGRSNYSFNLRVGLARP